MKPHRIVLALALASLAAPALAGEKCVGSCTMPDEIVVGSKKSAATTPLQAPGGLAPTQPQPPTQAGMAKAQGTTPMAVRPAAPAAPAVRR